MAFQRSEALQRLTEALDAGRLGHAYLFAGPRGGGKTDLARELAARLLDVGPPGLASHPDFHVAEPESKSRRILTDQIRRLEHALATKPFRGGRKVALIGDADRMQPQAANAFLKTLEEPPPGAYVFLLSSMPGALLETIVSRCIVVQLLGPDRPALGEVGESLLDQFEACLLGGGSPVTRAFRLARAFQDALARERERIRGEFEAALKLEEAHYKQRTDGTWLEEREEQFKAMAEAAALRRRTELLQVVFAWLSDLLRILSGVAPRSIRDRYAEAAQMFSAKDVLRQIQVIEDTMRDLERGMHEPLALEAGFLKFFLVAQ